METNSNNDAIPLYTRLESLIRNQILRGQLEPGEKLPNEPVLEEKYGVSRITVRTALANLKAQGLVVRKRAKGTFVSEEVPVKKHSIFSGNVREMILDSQNYEVKVLGIDKIKVADARVARDIRNFLRLSNDDDICWVRRLRSKQGIPIYFKENFLPAKYAEYLTEEELSQRPRIQILKEKAGLDLGHGEFYIEAVPADVDVAKILGTQLFEPLVLIQIYYWRSTGEPSDLVNLFIRGDYFRYKVEFNVDS